MKKLLTLLCCVGLMFSMAACSSNSVEDEALDALETSINKIVEMKSASYSLSIDAKGDDSTGSFTIHGGYLADTANPSFTAVIDMESEGAKMENFMGLYLKDNTVYMDMALMDLKQKSTMDEAEDSGLMPEDFEEIQNFKMNKDEIKPYLKKASLDGDTLTLELDPVKLTEAVKEQGSSNSLTASAADNTYSKFNLVVNLKDGFMTKAVMDFEGTSTSSTTSEKENMTGKMTLEFTNINEGKELIFPDFSDYVESADMTE